MKLTCADVVVFVGDFGEEDVELVKKVNCFSP